MIENTIEKIIEIEQKAASGVKKARRQAGKELNEFSASFNQKWDELHRHLSEEKDGLMEKYRAEGKKEIEKIKSDAEKKLSSIESSAEKSPEVVQKIIDIFLEGEV